MIDPYGLDAYLDAWDAWIDSQVPTPTTAQEWAEALTLWDCFDINDVPPELVSEVMGLVD